MATIQERYNPRAIAANTTYFIGDDAIGGFICTADGTISIKNKDNITVLNNFPVSAGVYYPLPMFLGWPGSAAFITDATAAGTLLL